MLYSVVLFVYFMHLSWNHITNQFSSKESSNVFRWFLGISEKSISLFLLNLFKGIRSFSVREALGFSNSWREMKNREKQAIFKNDILCRWKKLNPKVFGVSLLFICNFLSKSSQVLQTTSNLIPPKKWQDKNCINHRWRKFTPKVVRVLFKSIGKLLVLQDRHNVTSSIEIF